MTAGLAARDHQNVDARGHLLDRVFLGPHQRRNRNTAFLAHLDHSFRRRAQRVCHQFDRVREDHIQDVVGFRLIEKGVALADLALVDVAGVDAEPAHDRLGEMPVLFRQQA